MSMVDLNKFDLLGIFEIDDNKGIESLTTPLSNGKFLSRKYAYYIKRNYAECSFLRDEFKKMLNENLSNEKNLLYMKTCLICLQRFFIKNYKTKTWSKTK